MQITRRHLAGIAAAAGIAPAVRAQARPTVRLGVLSALTGETTDAAGLGSVIATQMAAEDFIAEHKPPFNIDVVAGDMLDKPDVGASVARTWLDRDNVDAILDVPNSAVALAVAAVVRERNKVALFSASGTTALSLAQCSPNHLQWTYDTSALANCTGRAVLAEGGKSWFFITADYAFGHNLQAETERVIKQGDGNVLGSVAFPYPDTTDYASYLLQAQASGADVIGLACSANNFSNLVKQAAEFRITDPNSTGKRQRLASLICFVTNVHAIGLRDAQGLVLTAPFYWDLNDDTRAFARRFAPRDRGIYPTFLHAGAYSAATHYLKALMALGVDRKSDGRALVAGMKALPADDPLFGRSTIRANGSVAHAMMLFQVKTPAESKYPWDYYRMVHSISADEAFMPPDGSKCSLL